MKKPSISIINSDSYFDNDNLFLVSAGLDNALESFRRLKEVFESKGYEIHTSDILPPEDADILIFLEVPDFSILKCRKGPKDFPDKRCFLIILECILLRPNNFNKRFHEGYEKIFTWDDNLIALNPELYNKINFAQVFDGPINKPANQRSGFMACISGNKRMSGKGELYSKRLDVIKFYEKKQPLHFSLFGSGWSEFRVSSNSILRPLNFFFRRMPEIKYLRPLYRGRVESKLATLKNFKFNLCFENYTGQNGYITEKIFDSFMAGSIPVYWGPDNIEEYIPSSVFIDYRKFKNVSECHNFLSNLDDATLIEYQKRIKNFLTSTKINIFKTEYFVNTIVNCVTLKK